MSDTIKKVIDTLLKYGYLEEDDQFEDREGLITRLSSDCSLDLEQINRILVYLKYPVSIDELKEYEDDGDITIVAAKIASKSSVRDRIRFIFYTPLEETFSFPVQNAIVFTGSGDPWVDEGRIPALCNESGIPCSVIPDANHSLETADPAQDILTLQKIMFETEQYMAK